MIEEQMREDITKSLQRIHDSGVGSKTLAKVVTRALFDFICSEAGAFTPQAVDEITEYLQELLMEVEAA